MKTAWILDVDGVITDPFQKKITQPEILDHIIQQLEENNPVALNTGRSLIWMIDRVINQLLKRTKNKKNLKNFFASGEKGGTWITFDKNGEMQHHKDKSISVSKSLQNKVRNIVSSKFSRSMFYDETKETMITIEMKDGCNIEEFFKNQKTLNEKLKKLVDENYFDNSLKLDPTVTATDIENKHVGKGFAVERILQWLKKIQINPLHFITLGDSIPDISMAEKLYNNGLSVEFVYAGKKDLPKQDYPFKVTKTKKLYTQGIVGFIDSL